MLATTVPVEVQALKPSTALVSRPPDPPVAEAAWYWKALRWIASQWLYALAAVVVLVGLWYFGVPYFFGPIIHVTPVVRADFVQSVVATGHVQAEHRVSIGSRITGMVAKVLAKEGQRVKTGDTLIELDDTEVRASVTQAEGALTEAEAKIRQFRDLTVPTAETALAQAKATLRNAEQVNDRMTRLAAKGLTTKVLLDEANKALAIANQQVSSAELQIATSRPEGSDYVMAETRINQARANLDAAKARLAYTVIAAPSDGVLIARTVEPGSVVQPGAVLMELSPAAETQLVVQIDEKNLGLIAVGQQAVVSADAFPKERFQADVTSIDPRIDLQKASITIKLGVPKPPPYLREDMTVWIDLQTAIHKSALILPASEVHDVVKGSPWVMKLETGRAKRQAVQLGLVAGGKAEILDGLAEGDQILTGAVDTIKDGGPVRVQALAAAPAVPAATAVPAPAAQEVPAQ